MAGSGFKRASDATSGGGAVTPGAGWDASGLAKEAGGNLAAVAGKDFATQVTLAAVLAKLDVALSTRALEAGGNLAAIKAKTDNLPTDPAKESGKLTDLYKGSFFDLSATGGSLAYDGAVKTAALAAGIYIISPTTTCHVKTGPQATVAAAIGTSARVPENHIIGIVIDGTNNAIAAIKESEAGTVYYLKVG